MLRIKDRYPKNKSINVNAPTEEKVLKKEKIYEGIHRWYNKTPIIIFDFNTKIGKETIIRPTMGEHSNNEESNGLRRMLRRFTTESR